MGSYTLIQLLGYIAPLLALPVIARSTSTEGWASLGLGQAVGVMASVIIGAGWLTVGPVHFVQEHDDAGRHALYRRSLLQRALIAVVVTPLAVTVAAAIAPGGYGLLAALAVVGMASLGLSPGWYFIAAGAPSKLMRYDAAPRVASAVVAAAVVAVTGDVLWYPALLAIAPLVAYAIALRRETPAPAERSAIDWPQIRTDFRQQAPIAASGIVGGLYSQLMVPFVAVVAPASTAVFVSGDRLYKAGRFTISAAANTFQPWTLQDPSRRRHMAALLAHTLLGVVGLVASWLLMPPVSRLMFGADLAVPSLFAAAFGFGFMCTSIATPLIRNVLIPAGRRTVPLIGALTAAGLGVAVVAGLYPSIGADAVAVAVGASELGSLLVVAAVAAPILRGLEKIDR